MSDASTLGDLVARGVLLLNDGYRTRTDQLGAPGIPILRVADVMDGHIQASDKDHIRDEYRPKMGVKISQAGDVLITTKGTVGRVAEVPRGFPPHAYSPQLCFLRSMDSATLDPSWLYQWARSPQMLTQLGLVKDQTDMAPYVSLTDLRRVEIEVPELYEQRRIAGVLGALDDLIEHDRVQVESLACLAMAALSAPGEPTVPVSEVATLSRGLSYKGAGLVDASSDATPMVNLGNFTTAGWFNEAGLKYYNREYKPTHVLREFDLLIANTDLTQRREILGRGMLVPPRLTGAIHSHHTSLVRSHAPWIPLYLWAQLQTPEFRERAEGFATGTTVAALPPTAVLEFDLRLPSNAEEHARSISPVLRLACQLEEEIADLTRTRDELLPLLMSGRVRVREVA